MWLSSHGATKPREAFRSGGFIEELRDQAESGEAGEAPILEEGSDGVRLMTVHKAKGLEFPIVILADMTGEAARAAAHAGISIPSATCAQSDFGECRWPICSMARKPKNAVRSKPRVSKHGVHVAATRARDLLGVIPAVGDEERERTGSTAASTQRC